MIYEDQVFVTNVVVIDLTWDMVVANVISRQATVVTELGAITKDPQIYRAS
jgi:hypothetical protein